MKDRAHAMEKLVTPRRVRRHAAVVATVWPHHKKAWLRDLTKAHRRNRTAGRDADLAARDS